MSAGTGQAGELTNPVRPVSPESLLKAAENAKPTNSQALTGAKYLDVGGSVDATSGRLSALWQLLGEPKVAYGTSMVKATWQQDTHRAKLTSVTGKVVEAMGYTEPGGNRFLWGEETLFLLESGVLDLRWNGVPISVQQGMKLMVKTATNDHIHSLCSFSEYVVYKHLLRLGYRVIRHSGMPIKRKRSIGKANSPTRKVAADSRQPQIYLPNCYGLSEVTLPVPPDHLLPEGARPKRASYTIKVNRSCHIPDTPKRYFKGLEVHNEPMICPAQPISLLSERKKSKLSEPLLQSKLASLWSGKTKPLLRPCEATSSESLQQKLQIEADDRGPNEIKTEEDMKIAYDMYLPNVKLRKKSPGMPNYRICVLDSDSSVPSSWRVQALLRGLKDDVPTLFAVVHSGSGSVAFYMLAQTDIVCP